MNPQVIEYLKTKSINVIEEDITSKLLSWEQWYRGRVDGFHEYQVYQGKEKLNLERKTLNMPLKVCQRWADLLWNEKAEITVDDDYTQDKLNQLLTQVNFSVRGNNLIERAFAMGGGFLIQYWDGEKTNQKYISQEMMIPITFDSGRLVEAAFASKKTIDGEEYTYLETHLLDDNREYVIDNTLLRTDKESLTEVSPEFYEEHGIEAKFITRSKEPLFQMIRPNVANRDDFNSAFGTSVFSGAIDTFKSLDVIYDSYYKEFLLGKKRIFVHDGVSNINFNKNGEQIQVFDPQDEVFYRLPDADNGEAPIQESNGDLRVAAHDTALQTQLNILSQQVGFGSNGFKWNEGAVSTATQIISQNSEMFRTLKKHEILLKDAIIKMAKGLLFIESTFGGDKAIKLDADISIDFDDSIIEDTAEIRRQAMLELNAGLIDAIQYYQDVYKLTEDQAIKFREKIESRAKPVEEEPDGA